MAVTHKRRNEIIRLPVLAGLLLAGLARFASAQGPAAPAACGPCLVLELPAEALIASPPAGLSDLTVYARSSTPELARRAAQLVRQAGGEAGALIDPEPGPNAAFAMRSALTVLRGLEPGLPLVVDADALLDLAVPIEAIAPYADHVMAATGGPGRWRRLEPIADPSAAQLIEASLAAGGTRTVLPVGRLSTAAVAGFAASRAIGTAVTQTRTLSADEIVARHQAKRAIELRRMRTSIATGTTSVLFEVPGMVAPVTITADTVIFSDAGQIEIEERNIRVNGAAIAGGDARTPPQLPLIEPERIATPPLVIAFTDAYRYELLAPASIDGRRLHAIAFSPRAIGAGLASGRAWIDAETFALVRLITVQSGLRGAIVSSEQDETYTRIVAGDGEVWLPRETRIFQVYEGAGHRTPIHRTVTVDRYEINPPDFAARLAAAHASNSVMLRDTPEGLRYLTRRCEAGPPPPSPSGTRPTCDRVVDARSGQRIRAAVFGLVIDPNITRPLPFAGISYVDLDLFGTGAQVNAFAGGTFGQLAWSVPSLAGSAWQLHGSAFAIATRYHDRVFVDGRERYEQNLLQRPARFTAGVLRPLTPRLRLRAAYELDVNAYTRASSTAASVPLPGTVIIHGVSIGLDAERGAWGGRVWWNPGYEWCQIRCQIEGQIGVRPRSGPGSGSGSDPFFHRAGVQVTRTLAVTPAVSSRIEATWVESHGLDRFTRFSFNSFDNRLHGYPTASIRYDRGAITRSVTTWSAGALRFDFSGDLAAVRDAGFGEGLRAYPGFGIAAEVAGPFRTLWAAEWGYGARGGTHAIRISGYRTF